MPGRARTTPAPGAATPLRFAFSSCQNWESGAYAAHRHLAEADLDLFVFLGDYIYESGPGNRGVVSSTGLREHDSPEVTDLEGYRNRYALYKTNAQLKASHAACPWLLTWDDHEVDNNHAGLSTEDGQGVDAFRARRADAYKAWWEHQPVRLDPPIGDSHTIYRTISWGDLADVHMLDGRQYRDPIPSDGDRVEIPGAETFVVRRPGPTSLDPDHSMLGLVQERWLVDAVESSQSIWQLLGNQVYMHGLNVLPLGPPATAQDTWDGYAANRARLLESLSSTENLVVLTGDFHATSVADVRPDPFDSRSPIIAAEFMAPAISSTFPQSLRALAPLVRVVNPQIKYFDPRNGFMVCEVDRSRFAVELMALADVTDENSTVSPVANFTVEAGQPGIATVSVAEA